eukprot:gene24839-30013_t
MPSYTCEYDLNTVTVEDKSSVYNSLAARLRNRGWVRTQFSVWKKLKTSREVAEDDLNQIAAKIEIRFFHDKRYSEDQIISIMNIVSYLENERRGFVRYNDEDCYRDERRVDRDGRLYKEALRGVELTKFLHQENFSLSLFDLHYQLDLKNGRPSRNLSNLCFLQATSRKNLGINRNIHYFETLL